MFAKSNPVDNRVSFVENGVMVDVLQKICDGAHFNLFTNLENYDEYVIYIESNKYSTMTLFHFIQRIEGIYGLHFTFIEEDLDRSNLSGYVAID